jgi:integrase/recombinase XerC
VERTFSYAVARAFAGHSESGGDGGATYIKADLDEIAAAVLPGRLRLPDL